MASVETFLGTDAIFPQASEATILVAAWVDAVHHVVQSHGKDMNAEDHALALSARLKLFGVKFAKSALAVKVLADGISTRAALMQQWT